MSLLAFLEPEPVAKTDEVCACGAPMERCGDVIRCSSGKIGCPVRVAMPSETRGDVINAKLGGSPDPRYDTLWAAMCHPNASIRGWHEDR